MDLQPTWHGLAQARGAIDPKLYVEWCTGEKELYNSGVDYTKSTTKLILYIKLIHDVYNYGCMRILSLTYHEAYYSYTLSV